MSMSFGPRDHPRDKPRNSSHHSEEFPSNGPQNSPHSQPHLHHQSPQLQSVCNRQLFISSLHVPKGDFQIPLNNFQVFAVLVDDVVDHGHDFWQLLHIPKHLVDLFGTHLEVLLADLDLDQSVENVILRLLPAGTGGGSGWDQLKVSRRGRGWLLQGEFLYSGFGGFKLVQELVAGVALGHLFDEFLKFEALLKAESDEGCLC